MSDAPAGYCRAHCGVNPVHGLLSDWLQSSNGAGLRQSNLLVAWSEASEKWHRFAVDRRRCEGVVSKCVELRGMGRGACDQVHSPSPPKKIPQVRSDPEKHCEKSRTHRLIIA